MAQTRTEVARQRPPKTTSKDLLQLLQQYKGQIEMALPRHITAERMMRVALTTFNRTPLLAECSATSICGALVQASILGLEPDGMSGEAFLIPYWNNKVGGYECQMQPGYKGIVKLARNTGEFRMIDAQPVHENDQFEFQKGSETYWVHKWDSKKERGPIYGYWAGYTLKDGGANFEFMSVPEIETHRDQYSQGAYKKFKGELVLDKAGNKILQGPWKDSPDWMYRKTPLVQSLKLAPKSYQLRTAMTLGDQADAGLSQTFVDLPKELNGAPPDESLVDEETPIPHPEAKAEAKGVDSQPEGKAEGPGVILITLVQARRLETIAEENGWRSRDLLAWLKTNYQIDGVADVRAQDYDHIVELIKTGGKEPPK